MPCRLAIRERFDGIEGYRCNGDGGMGKVLDIKFMLLPTSYSANLKAERSVDLRTILEATS